MMKLNKRIRTVQNTADYEAERLLIDIGEELASILIDKRLKPDMFQLAVLRGDISIPLSVIACAFWWAGYRLKLTIESLDKEREGDDGKTDG